MSKKQWVMVCGVCLTMILVGTAAAGASQLSKAQKKTLLTEKREEFQKLKDEYRTLDPEDNERASELGGKAKELAPVIGQLEADVEGISDDRMEMLIDTAKTAILDSISAAKRSNSSDEYINALEQYLQDVEAVEKEFQQHTRSNEEINAELDEVVNKWIPRIDQM